MNNLNTAFKDEVRETTLLSLPLIGSWLVYSTSGFIGTAMVARLGHDALAASVLINTLWLLISVLFFGAFTSVSVTVSHLYGARNYTGISQLMSQAFLWAVIACISVILLFVFLPITLTLAPQTKTVEAMALSYGYALLWSVPGAILLVIIENFLNGIGKTKLSLWISLIEVPIEIFLIYIFVFGKFGIPKCGIAGVGYGLAASYTITIIVLLIYLKKARFAQVFNIFGEIGKCYPVYFKELLHIGWPVGLMYLLEVGALTTATFLMACFSTTVLAAHQIVLQYLMLTINAAFAVGQAVSIRIGQNIGRNNPAGVRYASDAGLMLSVTCMLVMAVLYIFFPKFLLSVDLNVFLPKNASLIKEAVSLLFVLSFFQLFDGVRIIEAGALRGLKDTRFSMVVSFISFWLVGISLSYVFGFLLGLEGEGIWLGLLCGVFSGAVMLFFRLRYQLKSLQSLSSLSFR